MNTTHKAISTLFLATFLAFTPNLVKAQVIDTPATSAQVDALQATLIKLLTELIAQLQAQITELLAQQATQAVQLGAVQSQVNTVVSQTAPVVVATPIPTPINPQITNFYIGGYKSTTENTFTFKSNVSIDVSKTEFWIDGEKKVISILSSKTRRDGSVEVIISPSLFSFIKEGKFDSFQVKVTTTDGKVLVSQSTPYRLSTFNALSAEYFKVQ